MSVQDVRVAQTILSQLGGNKFAVITGAKNFLAIPDQCGGIVFRIASVNSDHKRVNKVKIVLTAEDLYTVDFMFATCRGESIVSHHEGVFADMLVSLFEEQTGLYTHL